MSRGCDWINAAAEKGHSRALQFLKTAKEATRQGGKAAYPLPTPEQIIKMDEADKVRTKTLLIVRWCQVVYLLSLLRVN